MKQRALARRLRLRVKNARGILRGLLIIYRRFYRLVVISKKILRLRKFFRWRYKDYRNEGKSHIFCVRAILFESLLYGCGTVYFLIVKVFFEVEIWKVFSKEVKLSHFIEGIEGQLRNQAPRLSRKRRLFFIVWLLDYPNEYLGNRYADLVLHVFRSRYWRLFLHLAPPKFLKSSIKKPVINRTEPELLRSFDVGSVSIFFDESNLKFGVQLERDLFGAVGTDYVVFAYTSRRYREKFDVPSHPKDNLFEKIPNPETYMPMVVNLRSKGLGVVRMGLCLDDNPTLAEAGLLVPRLSEHKSGFNDVWLTAHSKLLVTAHTGAYLLSEVFNKPWVATDVSTFAYPNWTSRGTLIFCLCWKEEEQEFASFQWMRENPRWCFDSERIGKSWKVVHNSPEQIVDVVTEKLARINGEWVDSIGDQELQKRFQRFVFGEGNDSSFLPRAGTKFLREYQHLLPD